MQQCKFSIVPLCFQVELCRKVIKFYQDIATGCLPDHSTWCVFCDVHTHIGLMITDKIWSK